MLHDGRELDVQANRAERKYGLSGPSRPDRLGGGMAPLRARPRPLWGWRRMLLRAFGARSGLMCMSIRLREFWTPPLPVERRSWRHGSGWERRYPLCSGPVRMVPRATVSQYAHLCAGTHDLSHLDRPLLALAVTICPDAWIAAGRLRRPRSHCRCWRRGRRARRGD